MSAENVDRLRELYAGAARGDLRPPAGLLSPDFIFEPIWDGREHYVGIDAFGEQMREFLAQWDVFRIEAETFEDLGDMVLVTEHQSATGKRSGVPIEKAFWSVWTFRDGVVVSGCWYEDRASALQAAGE